MTAGRELQAERTLTVMTYNVGNGMAHPDRLLTLVRESQADVVGLQELATAQAEAIAADLADLYPHQRLIPAGFAGKGLLSRYPLLDEQQIELYPGRPDLSISVDAGDARVTFLVVHLPPQRLRWTGIAFDQATHTQFEALASLAVEAAPAVLLGDFNMTAANPFHARLTAMGLSDAFGTVGAGRGVTFPLRLGQSARFRHRLERLPFRPFRRIDYIWYTAPLEAQTAWVGPDAGSDHLPVFARLSLLNRR